MIDEIPPGSGVRNSQRGKPAEHDWFAYQKPVVFSNVEQCSDVLRIDSNQY